MSCNRSHHQQGLPLDKPISQKIKDEKHVSGRGKVNNKNSIFTIITITYFISASIFVGNYC